MPREDLFVVSKVLRREWEGEAKAEAEGPGGQGWGLAGKGRHRLRALMVPAASLTGLQGTRA